MVNTSELSLDIGRGHDIAVGFITKVQFDTGLETPLKGYLIDGNSALGLPILAIHRAVIMIGGV